VLTAVVVGLLAGAFGSVIGPLFGQLLQRRQRREVRLEKRHQDIRTMLEERMKDGLEEMALCFRVEAARIAGLDQLQQWAMSMSGRYHRRRIVWKPHRIDDFELRRLSVKLNDIVYELSRWPIEFITNEGGETKARLSGVEAEFQQLIERIDARLDDLRW